jgi:hypothetical protein
MKSRGTFWTPNAVFTPIHFSRQVPVSRSVPEFNDHAASGASSRARVIT